LDIDERHLAQVENEPAEADVAELAEACVDRRRACNVELADRDDVRGVTVRLDFAASLRRKVERDAF
jgi:hypothetical protein